MRNNSFSAMGSSIESRESDRGINRGSLSIFFVRLFTLSRESRTLLFRVAFLFINFWRNCLSSHRVIVSKRVRFLLNIFFTHCVTQDTNDVIVMF